MRWCCRYYLNNGFGLYISSVKVGQPLHINIKHLLDGHLLCCKLSVKRSVKNCETKEKSHVQASFSIGEMTFAIELLFPLLSFLKPRIATDPSSSLNEANFNVFGFKSSLISCKLLIPVLWISELVYGVVMSNPFSLWKRLYNLGCFCDHR